MLWIHKLRATFIRVNVGSLFICLVYRHRFIYLFIHSFIPTFHTFLFHFSRDYNQLADFNLKLYIAFSAFVVNSNIRNWLKFVEIEDKVNSCGVFIYEKACNGKWANGQMVNGQYKVPLADENNLIISFFVIWNRWLFCHFYKGYRNNSKKKLKEPITQTDWQSTWKSDTKFTPKNKQ